MTTDGAEPSDDATGLVIAWCEGEPSRIGEIALFPTRGVRTLGRGDGDGEPRARFYRQRPGRLLPTEPLLGLALSRNQLEITPNGKDLSIVRTGRCALKVNGVQVEKATVTPGDTVSLRGQLLLLCVRRPTSLAKTVYFRETVFGAFGEPDGMGILGESACVWPLRERIAFAANSAKHVLLTGESGTGKELAARALHALSPRASGPFVSRNAATLPAGLIDAELFGSARNYPNAGMPERPGLIGQADGGTLFLDELAELTPEHQTHLLRVLDADGEYQRLGEATTRRSRFVLVGATNREKSALKHDLAARLTFTLALPGLEERREDIPLLIRHLLLLAARDSPLIGERFIAQANECREPRVSIELVENLLLRHYETHVRELDALLWRAIADSPGDTVLLSEELRAGGRARTGEPDAKEIRAALAAASGSVQRASQALGMKSRFALYRLMKKHGVDGGTDRDEQE